MLKVFDIAVVGAGIFGAEIALEASSRSLSTVVIEKRPNILSGASKNNQNRLHLGFHYPRDINTGRQCIRGFKRFIERYPECIKDGFLNAYLIANSESFTSYNDFLFFAEALDLTFSKIESSQLPVSVIGADHGILCEEVVYDCDILKLCIEKNLGASDITTMLNNGVVSAAKNDNFYELTLSSGEVIRSKTLVNATYGNINRITAELGFDIEEKLFEYTLVPIVELDTEMIGITIMDGPFMTLLPYGLSKYHLLYDVEASVIRHEIGLQLDENWIDSSQPPLGPLEIRHNIKKILQKCSAQLPFLQGAKVKGFLNGPRMVLPRKDATDERPSLINSFENSYFTVFAGKIDHSIWVAEDVCDRVNQIVS